MTETEFNEEDKKEYQVWLKEVRKDGRDLHYVPEKFKTFELCLIAVKENEAALEYVPENFKTPELCEAGIKKNWKCLQWVPEHLKTPELCQIAIEECGEALQYVPEHLKTIELCKAGVNNIITNINNIIKYRPISIDDWTVVDIEKTAFKYVPEAVKKNLEYLVNKGSHRKCHNQLN